jgi:hypothetical protein
MRDGGKGDARRPRAVPKEKFEANWDTIFKKPKRKMIDPPSGWKYGFPKEIPEHIDDTRQWLLDNGYPQSEIDACGDQFFVRGWWE